VPARRTGEANNFIKLVKGVPAINLQHFIGDEEHFPPEHRILNIMLLLGAFWGAVCCIFNYVLGLDYLVTLASFVSSVIFAVIHYVSVSLKQYKRSVFLLISIFAFGLIPYMWLLNGGISGATTFYVILFSSMVAIVVRGFRRIVTTVCMSTMVLGLIALEYKYPTIVTPYTTAVDRFLDISFGLIMTLLFNAVVFAIILDFYKKSQVEKQALIDAIPDQIITLGRDGLIKSYKAESGGLPGVVTDFRGESIFEVLPPDIAAKITHNAKQAVATKDIQTFEYEIESLGREEHYEVRIVKSNGEDIVAITRNVTERKRIEKEMKYLSLHDALTALYNRAFFENEMKRLEEGRETQIGLIVCDVDGLKIINDSLGHAAGDELLRGVAQTLTRSFRASDLTARIGGDEFAVIVPGNSVEMIEKNALGYRKR
jgi:predicted signal transduction protein with EAL and GGDEF domain